MIYYADNTKVLNPIKLGFADYTAGALTSLIYKGKEFVDSYDHGREWQSAWNIGPSESFNPTEAGSVWDGTTPNPSSSEVLEYNITDNKVYTKTRMAFWADVISQRKSPFIMKKYITIHSNYLEWDTEFDFLDGVKGSGCIEVLTGYMPREFNSFGRLVKGKPVQCEAGTESSDICLVSTSDLKHVIATYTVGIPQVYEWNLGYGIFDFQTCVKWNNVFRVNDPKGILKFKTFVAIGDLDLVVDTINLLMRAYR